MCENVRGVTVDLAILNHGKEEEKSSNSPMINY